MFDFVAHGKKFLIISGALILLSVLALLFWGLKMGIDFQGGAISQVRFLEERPSNAEIVQKLASLELGDISVRLSGSSSAILRFPEINEETHQEILGLLGEVEEESYELVGPVIGRESSRKARSAIFLSLLAIILYITWAFRKLSRVLGKGESWRYGIGAFLALAHDVLILLGFFAVMGYFRGVEINVAFITALLTVLGYSVNDTIVIYDRIRENLLSHRAKDLRETINLSLNETITRSLNTSLTTVSVLLAIYIFGGTAIQSFVLAMMVGVISGTWSSLVIASQFLLWRRK
jgi:preprotein translocase subunit SecF